MLLTPGCFLASLPLPERTNIGSQPAPFASFPATNSNQFYLARVRHEFRFHLS